MMMPILWENEDRVKEAFRIRMCRKSQPSGGPAVSSKARREAEIDRAIRVILLYIEEVLRGKGEYVMECL